MNDFLPALAVIPVRYGSTRLPAKPLLKAGGKYLFQHVLDQIKKAKEIGRIVIATDDERIMAACREVGAEALMTSATHPSGTDRVAEVARQIDMPLILNIQGDEPEIPPEDIDNLVCAMRADQAAEMGTLACPLQPNQDRNNPALVKVVMDAKGRALYFSRAPIPHYRDSNIADQDLTAQTYGHIGVYAFRREFLFKLTQLPVSPLERAEKLEQLRALEAGAKIIVVRASTFGKGVDTPADFEDFKKRFETRHNFLS